MAFVTVYNGVVFIEGDHPRAIKRYSAETRVGGFGAQLRNLNDLKACMANNARVNGCNCVVNFTYGQKSKLIAIDDVAYVGNGIYAQLSIEDYNAIVSQFQNG
ncbi:MAG: hypothetical protein E7554_06345 [Ruminococcaceae bacterium]|nr:hypothetical protein [Oscillospiraceae bacterium]